MSGAPPLTLARLNSMNQTGFTTALGFAFELSPWVVQRAWDERPFDTVEGLHAAMMRVLDASTTADKLALIRAHPELAGKAAI
ncbi:MAG: OHCU decarboxylase, partial [Caulobacter sp. 35-67-4]